MDKSTYYITTPIYYVNDVPHIGHAYTTILSDMMARFMGLDGKVVRFVTGTDEHGQKNAKSAEALGRTPQAHVDLLSQNFRSLCEASHASNTDFIRTTEARHIKAVQALWSELISRDQIYLGKYAGWYSTRDEAYYAESEIVGGKAPTGAPVEWVEEPSYFFRLSAWQEPLLDFYQKNPTFVAPKSRFNETIRFVESGLRDLSISRTTFDWGVHVPNDPQHVMYVWLDALTNYLTCAEYPDVTSQAYQAFWPADVHVVGKDILRFHAVYWPAFLLAAGLEPPRQVFAHGWWTVEGQKMSKSLGNGIDPHSLYETYGVDQVRYFMAREVPFGSDGDFSHKALIQRMNCDLANDFGNLVHRVLSFIYKNCGATIPALEGLTADDQEILHQAQSLLPRLRDTLKDFAMSKVCEQIWEVIGLANRYIDAQKPWSLKKTDVTRMNTVLAVLVDVIRRVTLLTQPIIPDSAAKILELLRIPEHKRSFADLEIAIAGGQTIAEPYGIFPKWEEEA